MSFFHSLILTFFFIPPPASILAQAKEYSRNLSRKEEEAIFLAYPSGFRWDDTSLSTPLKGKSAEVELAFEEMQTGFYTFLKEKGHALTPHSGILAGSGCMIQEE